MSNVKESHTVTYLQDFVQTIEIPNIVKKGNSKTQTADRQKEVEHDLCIQVKMKELHSPWQNMAEHGIGDLDTTTTKNMAKL